MPPFPDRIGAKTQKILRSLSVERQDFGRHWDEIQTNRYLGRLSDVQFERMCLLIAIAKQCGVPADEFSRRQLHKALTLGGTRRSTERKMRKLCAKVHDRIANRQRVAENHPAPIEEEPQDQAPRPDNTAAEPVDDKFELSAILENDNTTGEPANHQIDQSADLENNVNRWHPPMAYPLYGFF